jgi:hypothetical protein
VSGQLHARAILPTVPTEQEAGMDPEPILDAVAKNKFQPLRGFEPRLPASSLVTKLNELPWLIYNVNIFRNKNP